MEEIDTTKRAGHNGVDVFTGALKAHTSVIPNVREYVALAHLNEGQLAVVAVSEEV